MKSEIKNAIRMLDAAISPPAPKPEPRGEPEPTAHLTWTMVLALLKFAGLPDKKTQATLDTLSLARRAELEGIERHGHDTIKPEWLAQKAAAVDGKLEPAKILTRAQISQNKQHIRSVKKDRAAIPGRQGCEICANVLEAALEKFPAFMDDLMAKEAALFPDHKLPTSPLRALCDQMPGFIRRHIQQLRDHPGMVDPAKILK